MKFKTFKFMYLLSYQASIWLILTIGYFDSNRFFSIFSAFLAIVGAICTVVLYQKIIKVEKSDGLIVKCKLDSSWYQKRNLSSGAYFLLLVTTIGISISLKGIIGNLLSAAIALYVLFNDDKVDNISFRLCGLEVFNAHIKDQNVMCVKNENLVHDNTTIFAKKLTNGVYVTYNQIK